MSSLHVFVRQFILYIIDQTTYIVIQILTTQTSWKLSSQAEEGNISGVLQIVFTSIPVVF